jgi:signal transduction histidine kinase
MTKSEERFSSARFSRASVALVCAVFSAVVLALCVLGAIHFKRSVEHEFYRETENIAQILIADFEDDASAADAILTRLAAEIPEDSVSQQHEADLHQLLRRYALEPSMLGPAVLDRNGTLIASALSAPVPNIALGGRNTFRVHADTPGENSLYIGAPLRGVISNEWAIQFSRPLRGRSGALYGVVMLSYRLSHFVRLYEKLKLSDRGLVALTGKDGIVRIRSLNGGMEYGNAVSKIPLVYNRILAGETRGTFYGRGGLDDVTRIGTFVASQATPFYVTVGYDTDYLRAQYIGFFYVLGLCWFALTAAMVAAIALIQRVERSKLEIVNSAIAERQKISADMHDSIGASLAALLAYLTVENIDVSDVKRKVSEILMELRFLVDSTEADDDINLLLSNVRHRMGSGIELAGISLRWQAGELPNVPGLTPRDALAIKLILMEALSNVLHHSKAKTTTLSARYDEQASMISISVEDDGCGFNPGSLPAGRGLPNMRKRVASISTGATLAIDSSPGRGTTVRIELKVPRPA